MNDTTLLIIDRDHISRLEGALDQATLDQVKRGLLGEEWTTSPLPAPCSDPVIGSCVPSSRASDPAERCRVVGLTEEFTLPLIIEGATATGGPRPLLPAEVEAIQVLPQPGCHHLLVSILSEELNTRDTAIAHGALVDLSLPGFIELVREAGITLPVAITRAAFIRYALGLEDGRPLPSDDLLRTRLWDILWMLRVGAGLQEWSGNFVYEFNAFYGEEGEHRARLRASFRDGGDGVYILIQDP